MGGVEGREGHGCQHQGNRAQHGDEKREKDRSPNLLIQLKLSYTEW